MDAVPEMDQETSLGNISLPLSQVVDDQAKAQRKLADLPPRISSMLDVHCWTRLILQARIRQGR
jgi:hypothetical protein